MHGSGIGSGTLANNILLVYNTNSSDSLAVANYYVAHRPGMSGIDVLSITCDTTEQTTFANFSSQIRTPIINWLAANPTKPKLYIILCRGIPTRTISAPVGTPSVSWLISTNRTDASWAGGIGYDSSEYNAGQAFVNGGAGWGGLFGVPWNFTTASTYHDTRALVCTMDMGGSGTAATFAYIDKIGAMHAAMATPNIIVSATGASAGGSNYYLDSSNEYISNIVLSDKNLLISNASVATGRITYTAYPTANISSGTNVTGYETFGANGSLPATYATDGTVVFSGQSNWYLIKTIESYNGQLTADGGGGGSQGNFERFFSSGAFGGTSYSNTPIGMAGHTDEPSATGVEAESYLVNWENGYLAVECAWGSRCSVYFVFYGDPLIKR